MKGDKQKIRNGGCDGYIAKPISVANFLQTVSKFLEPKTIRWLLDGLGRRNNKARELAGFVFVGRGKLLDFAFLEFDVFTHDRIILLHHHFVCGVGAARVFCRDVVVTCPRRAFQLDLNCG
jgi:hypothetical protein